MSPEAWVGVVGIASTIIIAVIACSVPVWVRVGRLSENVKTLSKQWEGDQGEHVRMWAVLDAIPRVTTQVESLIGKVDELVKADRERLEACTRHSTRLNAFEVRLNTIGKQG